MIDELIVGHTYKLANGHEMKVLRFIPKRDKDMYSSDSYEIEAGGKTLVHTECYLKRLQYWEENNDQAFTLLARVARLRTNRHRCI